MANMINCTSQQVPPPLMTSERGSFAEKTIVERKPQIIQRVIADNDYPPDIVQALDAFRDEIAKYPITPLIEHAPDVKDWNEHQACYAGKTWREVPWYFAETYFYRRLLQATRYFQSGKWHRRDPFASQKRAQEIAAVAQLTQVYAHIDPLSPDERFPRLLHSCLWGNRADLSNFTVEQSANKGLGTANEQHNLLIDNTDAVIAHLHPNAHIAFINDNVGADSLFDLVLADFLLAQGWAHQITFHLKKQPFFVSDAMPEDVKRVIQHLQNSPNPPVANLGRRLHQYLITSHLSLSTDPFWTSCLSYHHLPPNIRTALSQTDLTILKGDVNYRRLLDDRHWPHTTAIKEADGGFPRPYLILRTLKGEIMVSLAPGQAASLTQQDPDWRINGKRGLIQIVK